MQIYCLETHLQKRIFLRTNQILTTNLKAASNMHFAIDLAKKNSGKHLLIYKKVSEASFRVRKNILPRA